MFITALFTVARIGMHASLCAVMSDSATTQSTAFQLLCPWDFSRQEYWKQPKCLSIDGWIKKKCYIYTMEYYLAIKRKEIMPSAANG